jgi:hypothetical protein
VLAIARVPQKAKTNTPRMKNIAVLAIARMCVALGSAQEIAMVHAVESWSVWPTRANASQRFDRLVVVVCGGGRSAVPHVVRAAFARGGVRRPIHRALCCTAFSPRSWGSAAST